jgi:hypothetical protein
MPSAFYMDAGVTKGNYSARAIARQPCRATAPNSSAALASNSIFEGYKRHLHSWDGGIYCAQNGVVTGAKNSGTLPYS